MKSRLDKTIITLLHLQNGSCYSVYIKKKKSLFLGDILKYLGVKNHEYVTYSQIIQYKYYLYMCV